MATPTRQWVRTLTTIVALQLLGSTLAMPLKPADLDLDHEVKPPSPTPNLDYVVKPPKPADLDLDHMVKPRKLADMDHAVNLPKRATLRELQMDASGEDQMDGSGTSTPGSGCDRSQAEGWEEEDGGRKEGRGIYGGGHGSGGTTFGFHKINPFPAFPFEAFVPEVSTWGEGGGYGGSNSNANSGTGTGTNTDTGMGVRCHCSNGYAMHYTMSPINFPPMGMTKRDGPDDMAPSSSP